MRNPLYFIWVGLLALFFLSACRLGFYYFNNIELITNPSQQIILTGLRFDISVVSYWLLPVVLMQLLTTIVKKKQMPLLIHLQKWYIILGLVFMALICISDVVFYHFYYSHLNVAVLNWMESPREVSNMLIGDHVLRAGLIIILTSILVLLVLNRFIWRAFRDKTVDGRVRFYGYLSLLAAMFVGMRGGIFHHPINYSDANHSPHYFFNQASMSPVFNLYTQLVEPHEKLYQVDRLTESEALELRRKNRINTLLKPINTPFLSKPNIVFILMEGMGSFKLKNAPFLDSLSKQSIYFDSFYSSGEHTYNGIFSSIYGEPAIMQKHMLRYMESRAVSGLPGILKKNGYFNIFHIPHHRAFDNMNAFLWKHHFDSLLDYTNIPKDLEGGSNWGTSDHLLYEYACRNLNYLHKQHKQPFFSVILSISDHSPYFIPKGPGIPSFQGNTREAIVNYADWSLRRFFDSASRTEWFRNTLFVLLGDHGNVSGEVDYPLPLAMHHIPCLIYAPGFGNMTRVIHSFGTQPDIPPTLCHLLDVECPTNLLSIDLFNEQRDFAYFCSDNYCGLLNRSAYYMIGETGESHFFSWKSAIPASRVMYENLGILTRYSALRLK